jgi:hypothetical protein
MELWSGTFLLAFGFLFFGNLLLGCGGILDCGGGLFFDCSRFLERGGLLDCSSGLFLDRDWFIDLCSYAPSIFGGIITFALPVNSTVQYNLFIEQV